MMVLMSAAASMYALADMFFDWTRNYHDKWNGSCKVDNVDDLGVVDVDSDDNQERRR